MTDFTLLPQDAPLSPLTPINGLAAAVWQDAMLRDALPECRIYRYSGGLLSVCGQQGVITGLCGDSDALRDFAERMGLRLLLRADPNGEGWMLRADGGGRGDFPPCADLRAAHAALCEVWGGEVPSFEDYYWRQMLERRRGVSEVYALDGAFAALVKAPFGSRLHSGGTVPAARGKGAATRLCRAILAATDRPVWVECAADLVGVYERCGFMRVERYTSRI